MVLHNTPTQRKENTNKKKKRKNKKKRDEKKPSWQTTKKCDYKGSSPLWCEAGSGAVCEVTRVTHSHTTDRIKCYVLEDMLWVETEATGQTSLACVMTVGMNYCNDLVWL